MNSNIINEILKGYIVAALWTEEERLNDEYGVDDELIYGDNDDDELEKIINLSSNINKKGFDTFTKEDIEDNSLIKAYTDIKEFIKKVGEDTIESAITEDNVEPDTIGHDLWLTRNGHGAGFFDGHYDEEIEEKFLNASREMGSVDLYINENGKLSFSNEHVFENKNNNMKILVNEEDLKYIEESIMNGLIIKEDLRRWFKEKWVDVSKKVGGKHPPCGRKEAKDKGYPKCRPSKKVSKDTPKTAGSYSKKEKKSMTSQKRSAEKKDPKVGKGNLPTMTRFDENRVINLKLPEINEKNLPPTLNVLNESKINLSEGLQYHLKNEKQIIENVYRVYSEKFFKLFNESRELVNKNILNVFGDDKVLLKTDIGKTGIYEGNEVYLDIPFVLDEEEYLVEAKHRGKEVKLNKPFRTPGGPKKFAVYVKSPGGNIKKVTFGDPNLRVRNNNKAAAKSFRARHKCDQKKDRTTAGYWSCNVSRYRKALGIKSSNPW